MSGLVTQEGRSITMNTGNILFTGSIDSDNKGFSLEATTIIVSRDMTARFKANFRTMEIVGVYAGGVREVGTDSSVSNVCEVVYTGIITKIGGSGGGVKVAGVRG